MGTKNILNFVVRFLHFLHLFDSHSLCALYFLLSWCLVCTHFIINEKGSPVIDVEMNGCIENTHFELFISCISGYWNSIPFCSVECFILMGVSPCNHFINNLSSDNSANTSLTCFTFSGRPFLDTWVFVPFAISY